MDSLSIEEASLVLLSGLHSRLQSAEQEDVWIPFSEIPEITVPPLSVGYAVRVAEILEAQKFVEVGTSIEDLNLPTEIAITIEGIRHLESKEDDEKTVSAEASDSGNADREITVEVPAKTTGTYGGSAYGRSVYGRGQSRGPNIGAFQSGGKNIGAAQASADEADAGDAVPASDRFVTIDHNAPGFEEMLSTVEEAEEVISQSNHWEGEDRDAVTEHLSLGRQLLKSKNGKIAAGAISTLLLAPLYSAYYAIAEEGFKDLIMAAIKAVATFFGIG